VAVLVAAACGGGGDARLSKAEYVKKANAICEAGNARTSRVAPPSLADSAAVERAIGEMVSIQRRALRKLRDLDPPEQDQLGVDEWLMRVGQTLDQMDAVRQAVGDGDATAIDQANAKGAELNDEAETFADAYGLESCSTATEEVVATPPLRP